jgi:hypothetical protein
MYAKVGGRICRVIKTTDHGPDLVMVDLQTGSRELRATSGKRPGPGWRPHPSGDNRRWVSSVPIVEEGRIINRTDMIGDEWPTGILKNGANLADLNRIMEPVVKRAMEALGVSAVRTIPEIKVSAILKAIQDAGLPIPTDDEFKSVLHECWEETRPNRRGRSASPSDGRTIIPPTKPIPEEKTKPVPEPEPELELEPAPEPVPKTEKPKAEPGPDNVPNGQRWSESMNQSVPLGELGDALEIAVVKNGWPLALLNGAEMRRKGDGGITLLFASRALYDKEKHGTAENHGLKS